MDRESQKPVINNSFYDELGDRWYEAYDDPVALLRAEGKVKHAWIKEQLARYETPVTSNILDIACGAGFLANELSLAGYEVTGLDASPGSLKVAAKYDQTRRVHYVQGDAYKLPFQNERFDVVSCMDFLEHVDQPQNVIAEASRVLKPGGLFFYHTFSKNWLSRFLVIYALEKWVKNTPKHMHVYDLFMNPSEVQKMCAVHGLQVEVLKGIQPKIFTRAVWKLLTTGKVSRDFEFKITNSTLVSYIGIAVKRGQKSQ